MLPCYRLLASHQIPSILLAYEKPRCLDVHPGTRPFYLCNVRPLVTHTRLANGLPTHGTYAPARPTARLIYGHRQRGFSPPVDAPVMYLPDTKTGPNVFWPVTLLALS